MKYFFKTYWYECEISQEVYFISTLARRSRCFPRKLENLQAVLAVFVRAYNRFVKFENVQNEDSMRESGNISLGCRIVGISSPHIFCDGWPGARSRGAAPHPAAFETFPIFSRHLRAAVFLLLLTFISSVGHSR